MSWHPRDGAVGRHTGWALGQSVSLLRAFFWAVRSQAHGSWGPRSPHSPRTREHGIPCAWVLFCHARSLPRKGFPGWPQWILTSLECLAEQRFLLSLHSHHRADPGGPPGSRCHTRPRAFEGPCRLHERMGTVSAGVIWAHETSWLLQCGF